MQKMLKWKGLISGIIILFIGTSVISSTGYIIDEPVPLVTLLNLSDFYADDPQCWLVLYNANDDESITWAQWYQQQRNIPSENMLELYTSDSEHLPDLATAQTQIFDPIIQYLNDNPEVAVKIIGIIAGYHIPGHYGSPPLGPGGKAIASALQDLNNQDMDLNPLFPPRSLDNPGPLLPPDGRVSKADMSPGHYMVARIDAPTLELAKELTNRAKRIVEDGYFLPSHVVWYDYLDPSLSVPCHCWAWLEFAVEHLELDDIPWQEFDSDTEIPIYDAMRFGTHDVDGWSDGRLHGEPAGPRILAYNLNSWGATTVRSTTAESGRYVPNAIDAGYAAALGATGEPASMIGPMPDKLLAGLREGWTLGESFYLANPYNDWMWILVGDPFLSIPNWFDILRPGDFDGDGDVDLDDFADFAVCYAGAGRPPAAGCPGDMFEGGFCKADFDQDGDVDLDDFATFAQNFTGTQ